MLSLIAVPFSVSASSIQEIQSAITIPEPRRLRAASRLSTQKMDGESMISSRGIFRGKMNRSAEFGHALVE